MALTPNLSTALTADQEILLARVVEEIDLYLAENFEAGKNIVVRTALLHELLPLGGKVMDALIATYTDAGWTIAVYVNAKQGPWLSMSETPV